MVFSTTGFPSRLETPAPHPVSPVLWETETHSPRKGWGENQFGITDLDTEVRESWEVGMGH